MKTREQVQKEILAFPQKHVLLALPTGFGKTAIALRRAYSNNPTSVLVVYPKVNLKQTWVDEYGKWGYEDKLENVTFTTYASIQKHANKHWDVVIFDEAHHITDRVLYILKAMSFDRSVLLSATVKSNLKYRLEILLPDLKVYNVRLKEAIDDEILPEPKIILLPLKLDTLKKTELLVKNPKAPGKEIEIPYEKRFLYKDKTKRYVMKLTEMQYLKEMDSFVEWYKGKAMGGSIPMKNLWLHKAGERLKWLARKKTPYVQNILKLLFKRRTLTFCGSIDQTQELGENCIHSKNKLALRVLKAFNEGKIDHITACSMLDEGCNLTSCQVGIFANINASEKIQVQRVGRLLRHKNPILIIPYFEGTREEEIVKKMLEGYGSGNTTTIKNLLEIKRLCEH